MSGSEEPPPESIRALRARGGRPTDLPDALELGEAAGYQRLANKASVLTSAEVALAQLDPDDPKDEAAAVWHRWIIELVTDDDLAEWFLAGLPADFVAEQIDAAARDHDIDTRPWDATVVIVERPFRCPISGETDETLALALIERLDPDAAPTLLSLRAVVQIILDAFDLPAATLPGPIRPRPTRTAQLCRRPPR